MDRSLIHRALTELADELHGQGLQADVFVVGGAAVTIAFEERASTRDVDAVFTDPPEYERQPSGWGNGWTCPQTG